MATHNRAAADDPKRYDIATDAGPAGPVPTYRLASDVSSSYARVVAMVLTEAGWSVELIPRRAPARP